MISSLGSKEFTEKKESNLFLVQKLICSLGITSFFFLWPYVQNHVKKEIRNNIFWISMILFRVSTNLFKHLYLLSSLSYLLWSLSMWMTYHICKHILFWTFSPKVTVFLDKSGSKLNYRLYGEYLFDILFAGGVLGISLIFLFWLVNTEYFYWLSFNAESNELEQFSYVLLLAYIQSADVFFL